MELLRILRSLWLVHEELPGCKTQSHLILRFILRVFQSFLKLVDINLLIGLGSHAVILQFLVSLDFG